MHRLEREGRVSQVMRSLLDVLHSEAGTLPLDIRPHRPVDLAARAIDSVSARAHAKSLVLDGLVAEIGEVPCDRERVVGVLAELVSNAIAASHDGGTIKVRAEAREEDVLISVSDSGEGIDPADWPHLFARAWEVPEGRHAGLGLGLAHAKAVIQAHGGGMWASSQVGEGTTFSFSLPRANDG